MKRIAIIGSGFGGLALGIRLQTKGYNVDIYEKNKKAGGHAYSFEKKGYRFDMGPSLITAPDIIQDLFKTAGHDLYKDLELIKLDPFYRICFHDGTSLDYTSDTKKMKSQLDTFNKKDAENYDRFMKESGKIYNIVIKEGQGRTPFLTIGSLLKFAPRALKMNSAVSTYRYAKKYFRDPRSRFVFSFHPLFIGGNPFRTPAVYEMIPFLEKTGGVWYCKGGMYSLVKAMGKIFLETGGKIHTETEVNEIIIKNNKATGVRIGSDKYDADAVISNADFIHTYRDLLNSAVRRKWTNRRLNRLHYSMSAFIIYMGVKKKYPQLLTHTIALSHRYRELIRDIFDRHVLPDDFSLYLYSPSRTDKDMAPEGCESIYALSPVANLKSGTDWKIVKTEYRNRILQYLENDFGLGDLRKNLDVLEVFTPLDFQNKQNAAYGSAWGVEPRLTQSAYFRPHNRSEDIKNLYIVGASTHPGAGLPGCLLTAETTETLILKEI